MNKSALLIAGSGFLGKCLLTVLLEQGYRLGCADIVDPGMEGVQFFALNLLEDDEDTLRSTIRNYDIVINCSGQVTNPVNVCLRLNSEVIDRIVRAVNMENKFLLHFSTVTVYGSCAFSDEQTDLNPETTYSAAKAFSEFLVSRSLGKDRYCILRLSNLYGEGQSKGVFSYLYRSYNSDRILFFNNDGYMVRYYLHVKDCALLTAALLEKNISGIYNLIGPDKFTLRQLIDKTASVAGCVFETSFNEVKAWDNTQEISDSKLQSVIPISYRHSIERSLQQLFHP